MTETGPQKHRLKQLEITNMRPKMMRPNRVNTRFFLHASDAVNERAEWLLWGAKQKHDSKYHSAPKMIPQLQLFIPYIGLALPSSLLVWLKWISAVWVVTGIVKEWIRVGRCVKLFQPATISLTNGDFWYIRVGVCATHEELADHSGDSERKVR